MKYALIGKKLGHSYSALIHKKRGLDYSLIELAEEEVAGFCAASSRGESFSSADGRKYGAIEGFNATIPYKKTVMPYLSGFSEEARAVGAVNTVVKKSDGLYGYNTDVGGLAYAFKRKGISVKNKVACILGGGGAAAAAKTFLTESGAKKIYSVTRSGEINFDNYGRLADTEILINATPVGMFPNGEQVPVDVKVFGKLSAVFDCVYNPQKTRLVKEARMAGIIADTGLSMLVEQALFAEDIWLGIKHTEEESEELIKYVYKNVLNVVLTGMPSAGKSEIGKRVAKKLGREFFDSDAVIKEKTGESPENIIKTRGEKEFRKIESEVISELSSLSGAVIATGGGAVTVFENVEKLKRNGVIIYIDRDVEKLSSEGRPLSAKEGIAALYEKRKPLYENAADCTADNNGTKEECETEVIKAYEIACDKRSEP